MAAPTNPIRGAVYRDSGGATYTYCPVVEPDPGDPNDLVDPFPWEVVYPEGHPRSAEVRSEWLTDGELPDRLTLVDPTHTEATAT